MNGENKEAVIERKNSTKYWTTKYKVAFLIGGFVVCYMIYSEVNTFRILYYLVGFPIGGFFGVFFFSMISLGKNDNTTPPGGGGW